MAVVVEGKVKSGTGEAVMEEGEGEGERAEAGERAGDCTTATEGKQGKHASLMTALKVSHSRCGPPRCVCICAHVCACVCVCVCVCVHVCVYIHLCLCMYRCQG
jgi:hypothetical protein